MKNINKYNLIKTIQFMVMALFALTMASCSLDVQDSFEYKQDKPEIVTWPELTAYQLIQQDASPDGANRSTFVNLREAIVRTGLQSEYEQPNRTYLLLQDGAWGNIYKDLGGSSVANVPLDKLTNLLKYHIIDEYVHQDQLPHVETNYFYQTLLPGVNGTISLKRRNFEWVLETNASGDLPSTKKGSQIRFHNLVVGNGVCHTVGAYSRAVPF